MTKCSLYNIRVNLLSAKTAIISWSRSLDATEKWWLRLRATLIILDPPPLLRGIISYPNIHCKLMFKNRFKNRYFNFVISLYLLWILYLRNEYSINHKLKDVYLHLFFVFSVLCGRFYSDSSRINVQFYSKVSKEMVKDTLTDKTIS